MKRLMGLIFLPSVMLMLACPAIRIAERPQVKPHVVVGPKTDPKTQQRQAAGRSIFNFNVTVAGGSGLLAAVLLLWFGGRVYRKWKGKHEDTIGD